MDGPPQKPPVTTLDFCQLDQTLKQILLSKRGPNLSVRAGNICAQHGLDLIGDIIQVPEDEWHHFYGCGRKTVEELKTWAASYGVGLGTTIDNWPSKEKLDVLLSPQGPKPTNTFRG